MPSVDGIRVGLIGANPHYGWGSGVHRRVIELLPEFTLSAVCTTREESAKKASIEFGAPLWFTDAFEVCRHPEVDMIAICVQAPHHYEIAKAAIAASKHVYCEWPLAFTVDQAEELAALAAAQRVQAMIGLHLRGAAAFLCAQKILSEGRIGKPFNISLQARFFGPRMRAMAQRSSGTTLLSIYGGHILDAIDHFFGPIADISMRTAIHLPPVDEVGKPVNRDASDHIIFQGRLQNDALFSVDISGVTNSDLGCRWRIDGEAGAVIMTTREKSLPSMEALSVKVISTSARWSDCSTDLGFDCPYIPSSPDRYSAYPGMDASREALSAIGNLYQEMARAIGRGNTISPDFTRAVQIQNMIAALEQADK